MPPAKTRPWSAQGRRIAEARKLAGLDQGQLATAADVNKKTVSKWENGWQNPHDNQMRPVAELLGCTVEWLRYGTLSDGSGSGSVVRETPVAPYTPRVMGGLPFAVREWVQSFLLRLIRARVSEREFERARALLESEELAAWYAEGAGKQPSTEEAMLQSAQAAGDFILGELVRRGYKFDRE